MSLKSGHYYIPTMYILTISAYWRKVRGAWRRSTMIQKLFIFYTSLPITGTANNFNFKDSMSLVQNLVEGFNFVETSNTFLSFPVLANT